MQLSTDIELAKRIVSGDSDAENVLFSQFEDKINFVVKYRLKGKINSEDTEDIVSEIKLAILTSIRQGKYDTTKNTALGTYILGIVHNKIALFFRDKTKREKETIQDELPDHADNSGNALEKLINEERKVKIKKKLNRLKTNQKEILLLRFYEKLSIDEISKILKIDRKKVIDRIHYAFKRFLEECKKDNYFSMFGLILQIQF